MSRDTFFENAVKKAEDAILRHSTQLLQEALDSTCQICSLDQPLDEQSDFVRGSFLHKLFGKKIPEKQETIYSINTATAQNLLNKAVRYDMNLSALQLQRTDLHKPSSTSEKNLPPQEHAQSQPETKQTLPNQDQPKTLIGQRFLPSQAAATISSSLMPRHTMHFLEKYTAKQIEEKRKQHAAQSQADDQPTQRFGKK